MPTHKIVLSESDIKKAVTFWVQNNYPEDDIALGKVSLVEFPGDGTRRTEIRAVYRYDGDTEG